MDLLNKINMESLKDSWQMLELWKTETAITDFFSDLAQKAEAKAEKASESVDDEATKTEIMAQYLSDVAPKVWITASAKNADSIQFTTHPPKLTNPMASSKNDPAYVTNILYQGHFVNDGLVHSGNSLVDIDATTNAAYLPILRFLELNLSDGRRLIDHLIDNTEIAVSLLEQCDKPEQVRDQFLMSVSDRNGSKHSTSSYLPQVYFPVEDDYHLLTVLRPSSMLYELKKRINTHHYSDAAKEAKDARFSKTDGADHIEVRDLTGIGFGGTQPQNASNLNSRHAGVAFLLDSTPPVITLTERVRLPKYDFFRESCVIPSFLLRSFHNMALANRYVTGVEDWRDDVLKAIFEKVICEVYSLRDHDALWSSTTDLPLHQKIMLDCQFKDSSDIDIKELMSAFIVDAVSWFITKYQKQYDDEAVEFGPAETDFISRLFAKCAEEAIA
ncbi:type I-F CRISPR-associated protein Csy1 [Vibrio rotiferianus]